MDGSAYESVDESYDREAGGYSNANEGFYDIFDDDDEDDDDCDDDDDDEGDDYFLQVYHHMLKSTQPIR